MGAVVSGVLDASMNPVQIAQEAYYHKEDMQWVRQAYKLDQRSLNIDIVNTIREDLRDMMGQRSGRIENLMVVNTLLLSFAFDFVTNGTFPPTGDNSPWCVRTSPIVRTSLLN